MKQSSSWHGINADHGLSASGKVQWALQNIINNCLPGMYVDPELKQVVFQTERFEDSSLMLDPYSSPARILCDLLISTLPWEDIRSELGKINVLEIGCGTGRYGRLIEECVGPGAFSYRGVDMTEHEEWRLFADNSRFSFVKADACEIHQYLPDANIILTVSAIEHFDADLDLFRLIAGSIASSARPILQLHLMPSAACMYTFPWHGVRQYTPRTISKMTRLFQGRVTKTLFSLGASRCNKIHRQYITWPLMFKKTDLREGAPGKWQAEKKAAIKSDMVAPRAGEACFYGLLLAHNCSLGGAKEVRGITE